MIGKEIAFEKPGFESKLFKLDSHDLFNVLEKDQFEVISSAPRITERPALSPKTSLVDLEHICLEAKLFGCDFPRVDLHASLWWRHKAHWSYELQRRMVFRKSAPDQEYVMYFEDEGETPCFHIVDDRNELKACDDNFKRVELEGEISQRVSLWGENDLAEEIVRLAELKDMDISHASRRFGVMRLRDENWLYHPVLGVHDEL